MMTTIKTLMMALALNACATVAKVEQPTRTIPFIVEVEEPAAPRPYKVHIVSRAIKLDLTTSKVTELFSHVNEDMVNLVAESITSTAEVPGDRLLAINSTGGDVEAGRVIIKLFQAEKKYYPKTRFICAVSGEASSMMVNIMSQICDIRIARADSLFLFHRIYALFNGPMTIEILRQKANQLEKEDLDFSGPNAKALHLTRAQYLKLAIEQKYLNVNYLIKQKYLNGTIDSVNVVE